MARGGYTFSDLKEMTTEEIAFISHYQEKLEKERMDSITSMLGVFWDLNKYKESHDTTTAESTGTLFIPLSVAINPKILDYVKEEAGKIGKNINNVIAGGYVPKKNEIIRPMSNIPKDKFLSIIGATKRGGG